MAESNQLGLSRVRDYMTPDPATLDSKNTLLDAVLMLRRLELRHIPILDDGRMVGILTDRDVGRVAPSMLMGISPQDYNRVFEDTPVAKVMTRNLLSTTPGAPLAEAVHLLYNHKVGCLPVLEDGRLVGIITVVDMLQALHDLVDDSGSAEQG
jgi:acetoin utilization protein AcuB